jgi:hypothetical protein
MPRSILLTLVALVLVSATSGRDKDDVKAKPADKAGGGYVHIVLFTMKKDTPATAVDEVIGDCHKMLAKIAVVRSVKAGRPADKATPKFAKKNYDAALLVLIDDFDGLEKYLEDPLHLAYVKKHEKHFDMEKLQVFDFVDHKK